MGSSSSGGTGSSSTSGCGAPGFHAPASSLYFEASSLRASATTSPFGGVGWKSTNVYVMSSLCSSGAGKAVPAGVLGGGGGCFSAAGAMGARHNSRTPSSRATTGARGMDMEGLRGGTMRRVVTCASSWRL